MAESDPLRILLAHDRWATQQMLDACEKLSEEQFHRRFEMGLGSLHDTLAHVVGVVRVWTDVLADRAEPRPRLGTDGRRRTPGELRGLLDESCDELLVEVGRRPLEQVENRERNGRMFQFTRGAILTHMTTHGTHHRAQCLNMLRHLGVSPLPASSVIEWTWLGEGKA